MTNSYRDTEAYYAARREERADLASSFEPDDHDSDDPPTCEHGEDWCDACDDCGREAS